MPKFDTYPEVLRPNLGDRLLLKSDGATKRATVGHVNLIRQATLVIDDADIQALLTAPVDIVAAVGADITAVPLWAVITANTQAGAYAINGSALVQIVAAGEPRLGEAEADSYPLLSDGQADIITTVLGLSQLSGFYSNSRTAFDNTTIQVALLGTATSITGGHADNTLTITLYYLLVDL